MKHNDYIVIGHCESCGKEILQPSAWHCDFYKNEKGELVMWKKIPKYKTCLHKN